jgi:hypothetical protein
MHEVYELKMQRLKQAESTLVNEINVAELILK